MRIALLVATCFLLAGCTTTLDGSTGTATGLAHRNAAEAAAGDLDDSAELVGIVGAEWANETFSDEFTSDSPEMAALDRGADATPGDGRALAWGYLFATDGDPILVAVSSGGSVLSVDRIDPDSDAAESYGGGVIGAVSIDSDDAASIVRDNHDRFADVAEAEDVVVVMALTHSQDDGNTYWVFTAFRDNDEDFVFALVNAESGAYTDFDSFWD